MRRLAVIWLAAAGAGCRGGGAADPPPPWSRSPPAAADNSFCRVCHANFDEEPLALAHLRAGVGCETCHGPSLAHSSDEGNATPPDRFYGRADIGAACRRCHGARADVRAPPEACSAPAKACTDCHGRHRLERRTVRWDPRTRELLPGPG